MSIAIEAARVQFVGCPSTATCERPRAKQDRRPGGRWPQPTGSAATANATRLATSRRQPPALYRPHPHPVPYAQAPRIRHIRLLIPLSPTCSTRRCTAMYCSCTCTTAARGPTPPHPFFQAVHTCHCAMAVPRKTAPLAHPPLMSSALCALSRLCLATTAAAHTRAQLLWCDAVAPWLAPHPHSLLALTSALRLLPPPPASPEPSPPSCKGVRAGRDWAGCRQAHIWDLGRDGPAGQRRHHHQLGIISGMLGSAPSARSCLWVFGLDGQGRSGGVLRDGPRRSSKIQDPGSRARRTRAPTHRLFLVQLRRQQPQEGGRRHLQQHARRHQRQQAAKVVRRHAVRGRQARAQRAAHKGAAVEDRPARARGGGAGRDGGGRGRGGKGGGEGNVSRGAKSGSNLKRTHKVCYTHTTGQGRAPQGRAAGARGSSPQLLHILHACRSQPVLYPAAPPHPTPLPHCPLPTARASSPDPHESRKQRGLYARRAQARGQHQDGHEADLAQDLQEIGRSGEG